MNFGNTSDIVSAMCNIAMAGAAVYAALNAKGWFSQKSHTRGHEKAEEILSSIDVFYRNRNQTLAELYQLHKLIIEINKHIDNYEKKDNFVYKEKSKYFSEYISKIDKLSEELELMERWNILVVNKDKITNIIKHLREFNVSAYNTCHMSYICITELNNGDIDEFTNAFKLMNVHYHEFALGLHNVEFYYKNFKNVKFTDFFVIG
ncbi:hypothetical protein [Serratia plymuthica]|uniref:hypothetical protein n=1 Tax=Serratia plymuthica TaxID=82996 RepID=UPI00390C7AA0